MTLGQRLRFLFGFAWQDLFERNARRTTRVLLVTVAVLSGFTLAVYGLALGYERVRLRRLERDPLALCLWATVPTLGDKVKPEQVASLRDRLGESSCHPFREAELDWFVQPRGEGPAHSTSLSGRTLAPGDPLLESPAVHGRGLPLQSGRGFARPDEEGVIVTESMLRILEQKPGVSALRLRSRASGEPVDVPLLGLTQGPLPLGHSFLMTESYHRRLLTEDPNPAVANIRTGPVPSSWPDPDRLPQAVTEALSTYEILPPLVEKRTDGSRVWLLRSNENPPPLRSNWLAYVKNIHELMLKSDRKLKPAPEFVRIVIPAVIRAQPPARYDGVGIYVRDLPGLKPAAEVAQAAGLNVNRDVIEQIEAISRASRLAVVLLTVVVVVLGALSFWNIKVIQELRSLQKVSEIGMLKAIGMSNGLLRQVYLAEASLVWGLGTVGGAVLGLAAGLAASWALAEHADERLAAFYCPWYVWLGVAGLGGVACWLSTLSATRRARRASPIETLSAP
jgi:hypothetical protein